MKLSGKILRDSKGQAMPALGIAGMTLLAFAAVGIDIGRQSFTGTELQNIADAAAMSASKAGSSQSAAYSAANAVAQLNKVNGQPLTLASTDVVLGNWSGTAFAANGTPTNAVKVTATKTINNLISGVIGHPTTSLSKQGIATLAAVGATTPSLPVAVGESLWSGCTSAGCALPTITNFGSSNQNHAGCTSHSSSTTPSDSAIIQYLPAACGGGGGSPGMKKVDDGVRCKGRNNGNGISGNVLNKIKCAVCTLGMNDFVVPVVDDDDHWWHDDEDFENGSRQIQGFCTIHVNSFKHTGNGSNRTCGQSSSGDVESINISVQKNNNHAGPASTKNKHFGTGCSKKVG